MDSETAVELCRAALKLLCEDIKSNTTHRRFPFNLSVLSDKMKGINPDFAAVNTPFTRFGRLVMEVERSGYIETVRDGDQLMLNSCDGLGPKTQPSPQERRVSPERGDGGEDGAAESKSVPDLTDDEVEAVKAKSFTVLLTESLFGNQKSSGRDRDASRLTHAEVEEHLGGLECKVLYTRATVVAAEEDEDAAMGEGEGDNSKKANGGDDDDNAAEEDEVDYDDDEEGTPRRKRKGSESNGSSSKAAKAKDASLWMPSAGKKAAAARTAEQVEQCDVLVAEVTVVSFTVGAEIEAARAAGKKVLCLCTSRAQAKLSREDVFGAPGVVVRTYASRREGKRIVGAFLRDAVARDVGGAFTA